MYKVLNLNDSTISDLSIKQKYEFGRLLDNENIWREIGSSVGINPKQYESYGPSAANMIAQRMSSNRVRIVGVCSGLYNINPLHFEAFCTILSTEFWTDNLKKHIYKLAEKSTIEKNKFGNIFEYDNIKLQDTNVIYYGVNYLSSRKTDEKIKKIELVSELSLFYLYNHHDKIIECIHLKPE